MRHRKAETKLGRTASHRKAMLRNMVTSLLEHGRIVTTTAKAKAAAPIAEHMITLAKRGDLHARRQALSFLTSKDVTHKLFSEIKDRFMGRSGGYTSIVRVGYRHGDAAEMAVLELINPDDRAKALKKGKKKAAKKKSAAPAEKPKKETAAAAKAEPPKAAEAPAAEPDEKPEAETVAETPAEDKKEE